MQTARWAALLFGFAAASAALAGPVQTSRIFDDLDAAPTCQRACGGAGWTGHWRPVDMGRSICFCNDAPAAAPAPPPAGYGSSCSVAASADCGGCTVACPVGKAAYCTAGEPLADNQQGCWTQAKCECR